MSGLRRTIALLLVALALPAGAADRRPAPATAAPFLWEVQGPKARHALVGSVHLLPPAAHPLPAALEAAYAGSRELVFETDLDGVSTPEMQNRMLGAGREDRPGGLEGQIGRALFKKLQKRAAAMGMPTPVCGEFRAWFCALALELYRLQQANFTVEHGIDQYFYARARDDGRAVHGLESPQFQIALFTTMPETASRQILVATLDESTYSSQSPDELYRIWRTGDLAALERLMKDMRQRYPELHARLLSDRNRAWVPALVERLGSETPTMIIVGAAHFVGPDGLLPLLKAQGYDVKPAAGVLETAVPPGQTP